MAATQIADLIVPQTVVPNIMERALNANTLVHSGIVTTNAFTAAALRQGGLTFGIKTIKNIAENAGDPNVSNDDPTQFAVPKKISTRSMVGARLEFNDHFAAMDVAESVTGTDVVNLVINDASNLIIEWRQHALISILNGVLNETVSPNLVNTTGAAYAAGALIDTTAAAGDKFGAGNVVLVMSSRTKRQLLASELGAFGPASAASFNLGTYMGIPVLVDDKVVDASGVATIYMIERGAVEFATAPVQVPLETSRLPLAGLGGGESIVSIRDAFSYHPVGYKWVGTAAGTHPSFTELATAANWQKTLSDKAVGLARMTFTY